MKKLLCFHHHSSLFSTYEFNGFFFSRKESSFGPQAPLVIVSFLSSIYSTILGKGTCTVLSVLPTLLYWACSSRALSHEGHCCQGPQSPSWGYIWPSILSSLFLDLSIALGTVDHFLFVTWLFPFPLGTPHSLIFLLSLAASFVSPVFFLLAPKFPPFAQDAQGWSLVLLTSADLSSLLATYRVMPPTFRSLAKTCPPNSTLYDQLPSWTCISSLQLLLFLPKLAIHMTSHFSNYNSIPLVAALA